ncbi:MAG: trp operon repressor [Pseudomonadales bacterium]|nr:trp operon repressor [Pseudomonadales bacterium]
MNTLHRKQLIQFLCDISDPSEMQAVMDIILTDKEHEDVDKRLQIFHQLEEHVPQREVSANLGVGIATVTRGAKAMRTDSYRSLEQRLLHCRTGNKG